MTRSILVIVLLGATGTSARADVPVDVTVLFEQGVKDMRDGKTEIACKQLAAALAKYQDSGIANTLAKCYAKLGKVASAWALWKDLADTAPADMRPFAVENAAKLEPRLPRYAIRLQGGAIAGLAVTINGNAVADPTLPTAIPVDPGPLVVHAKAKGREDWTVTLQATEGATTAIDIPALQLAAMPPPQRPIVTPGEPRHTRRRVAYVVGGIGLAALGVGAIYGISAASTWSDSKAHCRDGATLVCDDEGAMLVDDTIRNGNVATILLSAGAVAAGTGAFLWITSRSKTERRLAVMPAPSGVAISMSGRF
jgi:hypothetical protein